MISDRIIGGLFMAVSLVYFIMSLSLRKTTWDPIGPALFPQLICVCMFVAGFLLARKAPAKVDAPKGKRSLAALIGLIAIFLYILLLNVLGYFPATFIFLCVAMWHLGPKVTGRIPRIVIGSGLTLVVLWYVFQKVMYVWLPAGILFE
ncbi:MAG: tripartite tricarboxylate transporter TctB family protein [Limnochordia bacterium]